MFTLNYSLDEGTLSIGELWEQLEILAHGRVLDNKESHEYPLDIRMRQMISLKALVSALEQTHEKMLAERDSHSASIGNICNFSLNRT